MKRLLLIALILCSCSFASDRKIESGMECLEASSVLASTNPNYLRVSSFGSDGVEYNYKLSLGGKTYFCAKQYQVSQ